ncbi:MAG: VOC family protein [Xanthomonadales bacterium]|nr:VOC family protein [Xanthomonadales bacterium]
MEQWKKQGTPNWADCATTDLDGSEKFYSSVFGWSAERITGSDGNVYSLQRLHGSMVAGIYALIPSLLEMGVQPHWGTYVEVDDLDATLARVKAAGGTVHDGPLEEPDVGSIAVIEDTVGAFLRLWHSAPAHGGEVFNVPGAMTWNELNTMQPEKAAAFYHEVLGVEIETTDGPRPYTLMKADGRPVAGILQATPDTGSKPSWDVYFATGDVDATSAMVTRAGGNVLREPFDIPGGGRMAVLADPQGAVFEVIKMPTT